MRDKIGNKIEQMTKSTNVVDKRLMDLYVLHQARKDGLRFGLDSTVINEKTGRQYTIPSKVQIDQTKKPPNI